MAGPNSARRIQGNRIRPKSVAVAIPMKFEKKKAQKVVTAEKSQNNVTKPEGEDTSSLAITSEPYYTPGTASTKTTNGNISPPADSQTLKSEHLKVSSSSQSNPELQQDNGGGVGSSWAGNAQSTCLIEHDQDFEDTHDSQITEWKGFLPHSEDSEQHRVSASTTSVKHSQSPKLIAPTKNCQDFHDATKTAHGTVTQAVKEPAPEHKESSNTNLEYVIDMAQLQKTNSNAEYPAHELATKAQIDGLKAPNARASAMAAATIRGLQEIAYAKRAAAVSAQEDGIPPSQDSSFYANDDVGKIAQSFGGMMVENGRRGSVGLRQESPSKRPGTDLRHRIHQHNPSQSSINFGSYHDSSHSSPAPHVTLPGQSFGPYPPPTQLMHSNMNSFSTFSPGLGFSPQPTPQIMLSPQPNNFACHHHPQPFGLSPSGTPSIEEHNHFHDSCGGQSFHAQTPPKRAQHLSRSVFAHSPPAGLMHGANAPVKNLPFRSQGSESYNIGVSYSGSPLQPGDAGDDLDGLLSYIHLQFNNATNADHHFQVNFAPKDGKQPLPLVLVGHSLLFSRSALLRQLMATDSSIIVDSGAPRRLITLNLNDRFARPDSVWIALQRLYGGSLLTIDTPPDSSQSCAARPGATLESEKFDLALGYAIIGQILQMPPVEQRGMEVACHFLHWSVLLKALDFAEGYIDYELAHVTHGGAGIQRKYGRASDMLLHEALTYIIINFPADFKLNTTVSDPEQIHRLPACSTPHLKKHHPKLSGMKFGDLRFDGDATRGEQGPSSDTDPQTILSSIFLNLPFPLLKYILESPSLGHNTEEISSGQRLHLAAEVIRERERRRVEVANGLIGTPRGGESQQETTLWWMESLGHRGIMPQLMRVRLHTPFGHELPA